jgi:hypothetical protein
MDPSLIDSLFGVKSFNFAVYQATIEDFYAIAHAVINEVEHHPKLFILCLDDWNFRNLVHAKDEVFRGAQNRLSYKPEFSQYLKDFSVVNLFWARFKSSLSGEQLLASVQRLENDLRSGNVCASYPDLNDAFYSNGVRRYYADEEGNDVTDKAENGQYDISGYLKKKHAEALKLNSKGSLLGTHEDFTKFDPIRLEMMDELLEYLKINGVKVILNIMPVQPFYRELLLENTSYKKRITDLLRRLQILEIKYTNVLLVKDNSDISKFGGYERHFFDHIHPTSVNSGLMLRALRRQVNSDAI